ncbi:hypothetical protein [Ferruginibacter sp.]|uniref:hypothetical protein n=1 Tax=Ferruginibacter sp. TaxID=1940288 RepID=UPI0019C40DA4|nr:hypothetical protein [Ferruginibacter sp.]MBC7627927.1 hypothetical protein [Ferruginibacter sp.]
MKEKTIVSTLTLFSSLASYWYAKEAQKDAIPFMMIGGFLGAVAGEVIYEKLKSIKNGK